MKKSMLVLACVLATAVIILTIGGIFSMRKESQGKEKQVLQETVKKERVAAQQIKNTFSDIQEIHFWEYTKNPLTGHITVSVSVETDDVKKSECDVDMGENDDKDEKYSGSGELPKLIEGKTENKIKVIFSDYSEEVL